MDIPIKHKDYMDQVVEIYRNVMKETFSDPINTGPEYHPNKLPGIVARLTIPTVSMTLDDEWKPEYEDYITEQSKRSCNVPN